MCLWCKGCQNDRRRVGLSFWGFLEKCSFYYAKPDQTFHVIGPHFEIVYAELRTILYENTTLDRIKLWHNVNEKTVSHKLAL